MDLIPDSEELALLDLLEAIIFASSEPVSKNNLRNYIPDSRNIEKLLEKLQERYHKRGIVLREINECYCFTTREDLAQQIAKIVPRKLKLGRASLDTLAVIAWHQPVTKPEIDRLRGVRDSSHAFEPLVRMNWIKPIGRRKVIGRPLEWATTKQFLNHFGLESIKSLPGFDEIKSMGLAAILEAPNEITGAAEPKEISNSE